jgi:hypothetical protein
LLVMFPDDADMITVPFAPVVPVGVTTPAETVAMLVLLDIQVATLVMSAVPLHVWAVAIRVRLVCPPLLRFALVWLSVID